MPGDRFGGKTQTRPTAQPGSAQEGPVRVPAEALFKGRRELIILHNADEYRLRVTSNGKLILTK